MNLAQREIQNRDSYRFVIRDMVDYPAFWNRCSRQWYWKSLKCRCLIDKMPPVFDKLHQNRELNVLSGISHHDCRLRNFRFHTILCKRSICSRRRSFSAKSFASIISTTIKAIDFSFFNIIRNFFSFEKGMRCSWKSFHAIFFLPSFPVFFSSLQKGHNSFLNKDISLIKLVVGGSSNFLRTDAFRRNATFFSKEVKRS